jgi:RNA polymerase sigma-70 factor (ECF subfamily)
LHDLLPEPTANHARVRATSLRTQRLHERYARPIFGYCLRHLRSREEAEDAAQMVFLNAHRALEQGIEPRSEQAWLFKIAEHVVMHRRRTIARRARVEFPVDLNGVADLIAAPGRELDPALAGLSEALARIPEAERRAIVLREWCGLSYREVANEVGVSVSAAENLIVRGRRRLAHELGGPRSALRKRLPLGLASPLSSLKWFLGWGTTAKVVAGATSVAVIAVGSSRVPTLWQSQTPAASAPRALHAAPHYGAQALHRAAALHVTTSRPRPATPSAAGVFRPPPQRPVPAGPVPAPAPEESPVPEITAPAPEVTAEPPAPLDPEVRAPEVLAEPDPGTTEAPAEPVVTDDPEAPVGEVTTPEPAPEVDPGRPTDIPGHGTGIPDWAGDPPAGGQPPQAGGNPEQGPPPNAPLLPPVVAKSDESGRGPAQGFQHDWVDLAAFVDPLLEVLDPGPGAERRVAEPAKPLRDLGA